MKRLVLMFVLVLSIGFYASSVWAQQYYYDLNTINVSGNDDGVTGYHDQWGYYAKSENVINLGADGKFSAGDIFVNIGMMKVGSLLDFAGGAISDNEGLNTNYEITTAWSNLTGKVTQVISVGATQEVVLFSYDPGTVVTVYVDDTPDFDATYNDQAGFTAFNTALDGIPILDITIEGGTGSIIQTDTNNDGIMDHVVTSSANLYGEITKVYYDNFILFDNGDDFYDLLQNGKTILTFLDQNADNFNYYTSAYPILKTVADHNGSIDFTVPEPATIVLVGTALLGLGTVLRKRIS